MEISEIIIWSGMLGGLLTLGLVAIADVVMTGSLMAWRSLAYMVLTGSSCVLLSGLPEALFPRLPTLSVLIVKASLGPLSSALTLSYLGKWLGIAAEDRWVYRTITGGSFALLAAGVGLAACLVAGMGNDPSLFLTISALVNCASVLMVTFASARAARLGDPLARWLVVACLMLAVSVAGLASHSLYLDDGSIAVRIITALATVGFFVVLVGLGVTRNRQNRRLERLAGLSRADDPATGLPRGAVLLSKVDDAFWRSDRLNTDSAVICLHLRNLYELSEAAGLGADLQILTAMTARIRRAVGFRCVVGLYHPRCFVVAVSAVKDMQTVRRMEQRLQFLLGKPLNVAGLGGGNHVFTPQFSLGTVTIKPGGADPATTLDEAERIAVDRAQADPNLVPVAA